MNASGNKGCVLASAHAVKRVRSGLVRAEDGNMVGKKQGHAKAYEVGQFLSKTAPFLVIDSSSVAREKALSQLLTLSASVSYTDAVVMAVCR
jgi:hypothetical protein